MDISTGLVKDLRLRMGCTQEQLARKVGVSLSTVQRWEKRDCKPTLLSRRELLKLMKKNGLLKQSETSGL